MQNRGCKRLRFWQRMAGKGWVNQPPEDARTGEIIHPVKGRQAGAMTVSSVAWASGAQGQGFRFSPESLPSSVRETCAARGGPNCFPATYMNPKRDGFDGGAHHRSSAGHTFMRAANSNEHSVPRRKPVRIIAGYAPIVFRQHAFVDAPVRRRSDRRVCPCAAGRGFLRCFCQPPVCRRGSCSHSVHRLVASS